VFRKNNGGSSRRWPVQYQHCAGRALEVVSIPRLEITDVPREQDDKEMGIREESWTTDLEEVRRIWMNKEEGGEEKSLLPTGRRRGERRVSQEFENLCLKFERRVVPDVWRRNILRNIHILFLIYKMLFKSKNLLDQANSFVIRGAASRATQEVSQGENYTLEWMMARGVLLYPEQF
jgi:hypothetical protein